MTPYRRVYTLRSLSVILKKETGPKLSLVLDLVRNRSLNRTKLKTGGLKRRGTVTSSINDRLKE